MKKCSNCKEEKDLAQFTKRGDSKRLRSHCRTCRGRKTEYIPTPDNTRICSRCGILKPIGSFPSRRESQLKHLHKSQCKSCDTDSRRERTLLRDYGITIEDYNKMFVDQEGKCRGCDKHQTEFKIRLAVDHCHQTGKVRGLLCGNCNRALGLVHDNYKILNNLINYLKETE